MRKKEFIHQDFIPRDPLDQPLWELTEEKNLIHSKEYEVSCDGISCDVYGNKFFFFALITIEDIQRSHTVDITIHRGFQKLTFRPLKNENEIDINGTKVCITFDHPGRIVIEPDDELTDALYLFVSQRITKPDNVTYFFSKGHVYNIGKLMLNSGDTVYIEDGAIVSGTFTADLADNISILGNGIVYGGNWHNEEENGGNQLVLVTRCHHLHIEGVTFLDSGSWHIVPIECEDVTFQNINILGKVITGDGLDILGCTNVIVENSFIRANDDCIAIKAAAYQGHHGCSNVTHIIVRNCLFWNAEFGNTLEIGYETRCEDISDIHFENCIVLHCEYEGNQSGGVLTIHDADRAYVHDIYYDNIIVEDAEEKLIDIKVLDSKYSTDKVRGKVSNIYFRNINVMGEKFPVSIIRGYEMKDQLSRPSRIFFENVTILGSKVTDFRSMHMVKELADDLHFS